MRGANKTLEGKGMQNLATRTGCQNFRTGAVTLSILVLVSSYFSTLSDFRGEVFERYHG